MKTLTKLSFIAILAIFGSSSCNNDQNENEIQEILDSKISKIHQDLETLIGKDVPSISLLIDSPKGKYFSTSLGSNGQPITEHTYFRFASNTKHFTSTAILNMMQDGWLNLDDKIISNIPGSTIPYVPSISEWEIPFKDQITIKQLLQHNSGVFDVSNDSVPGFGGESYVEYMLLQEPFYQFSSTDLIRQVSSNNLTYGPPNSLYHYSNTGYTILGEIISRVYSHQSGQTKSYNDYMRDFIYGPNSKVPLNIYFAELATDQQLPDPYTKGMIVYSEGTIITDLINASPHVAEGNGVGTMADLNRYIRTLVRAENVLTANTVNMMNTDRGVANTADNLYALGCLFHPNLGYGHTGATEGYLSSMFYDPLTDVSVIVLIPYWDVTDGKTSLEKCYNALIDSSIEARNLLGYE